MADTLTSTSDSAAKSKTGTNPLLFLAACAVFMLIGLMFLVWLGTDRTRSAVGKDLPSFELEPLLNVEKSLTSEQLGGKPSILFLWSPEAESAKDDLLRMSEIAKEHPEFTLISVAYSAKNLVVEQLREKTNALLNQADLAWPTYVDSSGKASMEFAMLMPYGSLGFPTVFVTNANGRISYYIEGRSADNWNELKKQFAK